MNGGGESPVSSTAFLRPVTNASMGSIVVNSEGQVVLLASSGHEEANAAWRVGVRSSGAFVMEGHDESIAYEEESSWGTAWGSVVSGHPGEGSFIFTVGTTNYEYDADNQVITPTIEQYQ